MAHTNAPIRISLIAIADSMALPINGIYEALAIQSSLGHLKGNPVSFSVEIVSSEAGPITTPMGLPIVAQRSFDQVEHTDVVITTSMAVNENDEWITGRYPQAVQWIQQMHGQGAVLCSSCTGALLMAETGLLSGLNATIHWAYAGTFRRNFPDVRLDLRQVLMTGGARQEFVMAGASGSWQDLVLHLIGRFAGYDAAQALGQFLLFQWHQETQAPYINFEPATDHGDAVVRDLQAWLTDNAAVASPVDEMVRFSGLTESTIQRRFKQATGYSPIQYVQQVRIERAKRELESGDRSVEEISWAVGYEDPAFFRRLFKRFTAMTPKQYRRKFQIPDYARVRHQIGQ